ncbi:MAG: esterase-like activity of phytase family protein [Rhodospirillales bacterium]|nr:esterase-like activity of phytase family protein [Rhodospirillales bacterium]MDH3913373.1 esterase-like activity of phytase family protein [Rhodospirillales bacterium]MDH3919027.1 esterase-like activity of phytase family protein [Rhodospirillales bacterium]MDH3968103.1 esterase-like activity of phytase family protein [Rhodospirillales bacterium]
MIVLAPSALGGGEPVDVLIRSVPLDPEDPDVTSLGPLRWCGSLELTFDNPEYGELSDIALTAGGTRLYFVADTGHWYTARPTFTTQGRLVGLVDVEVGRLKGPDGRPLTAELENDAEALTQLADGSMLVAFEGKHRILHYPPGERPLAGVPVVFARPPDLDKLPKNQGIEAMVGLADGRLLAFAESEERGELQGFLWKQDHWSAIELRASGAYRPTAVSVLPGGDLLITERRYAPATGVSVRIRRVAHADIKPGARLEGVEIATFLTPLLYDNIEGLAVQATAHGWVRLLLVSDDNRNPDQKTLLLCFLLQE